MASIKFYTSVLSAQQEKLLQKLAPFMKQNNFYLGGGTAIALLLGHRQSADLDWFSPDEVSDPQSWVEKIKVEGIRLQNPSIDKGTLHATARKIPVSLLEYRYPLLRPLIEWRRMGCTLASLDDLACMKLSAVAQRGSKKDFIDMYALLKKHRSLKQLLRLYQKKFNGADIAPVLYGLNYFDDAEKQRMPRMVWSVTWEEIKKTILGAVKRSLL